jgi:hypothetical protein
MREIGAFVKWRAGPFGPFTAALESITLALISFQTWNVLPFAHGGCGGGD